MPYDYIEEYQKQNDDTIWEFRDKDAQEKIDISYEETDYANPLSLETMQAQLAKNTKIKLDPIQDLHGYSKPWVGGSGKNLLPMTVDGIKAANIYGTWSGNTYVESAVTFTILTDVDNNVIGIKANGTSSKQITFHILTNGYTQNIYKGMIINGCTGGASNTFSILTTYSQDGTSWATENSQVDTEQYISSNYEYMRVSILIRSGVQVSNKIYYPMIRLSTESDATFEPYTNICPISGHDQIDILGCGKNLLPKDYELTDRNGITHSVNDDGTFILTGTTTSKPYYAYIRSINNPLSVEYGQNYVVSFLKNGSLMPNISKVHARVVKVKNGIQGSDMNANNGIVSFTVDDSFDSIFIYINAEDTGIDMSGTYAIQLEIGTSNTTYSPYTESNNLSIDLPSTVYGGVLDLESGELVVDRGIVDLGNLTWSMSIVTDTSTSGQYRLQADLSNLKPTESVSIKGNIICSAYENVTATATWNKIVGISVTTSARIYIYDVNYNILSSASAFTTFITGQKLCYELFTPFTLYISPEHLKLLKAQNNLTTSQYTQIKVTYRNGVFATLEELSDTANGIYDEISGDATTVSGNPINFTTREKQKSKSTVIDLEPIQDLHGFTKPWIGGAGKNKLKYPYGNTTKTANGVTFTDNDDGTVTVSTVSGGATADTEFVLGNYSTGTVIYLEAGNYIVNGCPSGGSSTKYYISVFKSGSQVGQDSGSGISLNNVLTTDAFGISIWVKSGTVITSAITFKPMIRLSTETDATFEPYTNICPISGRSSVDIDGCGKNLLPKSTLNGTVDGVTFTVNDDGSITANGTASALVIYNITLGYWKTFLKAGTYILSGITGGSNTTYDMRIMIEASQYPAELFNGDLVFTLNEDAQVSPRIIIRNGYKAENLKFYPMIRSVSNTNGEFKPYTPSTDLTISFGTTVYGGRLDVESGELVVDKGFKTFDGSSDENWIYGSGSGYVQFTMQISDCLNAKTENSCSNLLPFKDVSYRGTENIIVSYSDKDFRCALLESLGISNVTAWRTYLSSNNLQICYTLATPTTIQLTPQQVQLLKGINNISTTGTTITVTFKNGSVAHLDDLPENILTDLDKEKLATIEYKFGVEDGIPYIEEL